ncbi:MAG: hypothetical protein KDE34_08085 [Anaerolineales bacterium]|nr:hypothetical protein [Anaerolineales bacterium]
MASFVRYELDDETTLLVEIDEAETATIRAGRESANVIVEAQTRFREALKGARAAATSVLDELDSLPVESMDITFNLKAVGEAGIFCVGKLGMEANYQVTLRWKRHEPTL